jgi:hypothetical protein
MITHNHRAMAGLTATVALIAGVAAGLGVFARGDGSYETVTSVRGVTYEMATTGVYAFNAQRLVAEGVGWDVFSLVVAAPVMLLAAVAVAGGSFRGRLFAVGMFAYFFYQYLEYAMTWAFGPLFPIFILAFAGSLAGMVWVGASVVQQGAADRFAEGFPGKAFAVLSTLLSALLVLMWSQRIATGLAGDVEGAGLYGETTMVVQALDLGLVVPTAVFIAVIAWQGTVLGRVLASAFVVMSIAMAAAIVAMLLSAGLVVGTFELPPIGIFAIYLMAMLALALRMYRSPVSATTPTEEEALGWQAR